jgi:RimJ/RimL family protein N-acetyltransferase
MDWTLRPVAAADAAFVLRVFASTRAEELTLTGWPSPQCDAFVHQQATAQARHYQAHWPQAEHMVITLHRAGTAQDVGRLWLDRRGAAVHVLDIALLPAWRGQGLGGRVLRRLMADAAAQAQALTIYVEAGNPARRLYDRLGFRPVGDPDGVHQFMRWQPVETTLLEQCDEQA